MIRDFTYVDDIVESLIRLLDKPATPDPKFDATDPNPLQAGLRIVFLILEIQTQLR